MRPPNIIKSYYETNERNKLLDAQKQSAPSLPNGKTRSDERQGEKPNKAFNFNIQKIMKGIMFNEKYGLESAVLNRTKTRTCRADKQPRYEVGEVVAIKQCYCLIYGENKDFLESKVNKDVLINEIFTSAGWRNKMFVKNELMPHQIRITAVKKCRLQDLTDEDCLSEGINIKVISIRKFERAYCFKNGKNCETAKGAFADLIEKLNGKGYWESNPEVYAYEFELVK